MFSAQLYVFRGFNKKYKHILKIEIVIVEMLFSAVLTDFRIIYNVFRSIAIKDVSFFHVITI